MPQKNDLDIARSIPLKPISEIAARYGIRPDELELYGDYKAKVKLEIRNRLAGVKRAKYVNVSAVTPTPLGEGKTVTTIGLGLALNRIGAKAISTIRQPSMGPIFGIKGGAAGGGWSQVIPMEDFNLHLTGDIHAVAAAHNLLSAFIDNHLHHGNALNLDLHSISWPRVVDISDRALRNVVIGLGEKQDGVPRQCTFDIAVASEVMAILGLCTDIFDLRRRLGRIVVARNRDGKPVTAEDLKCAGAMTALLKDAVKPTLMQTTEGTACMVHTGPFANIAHGNSSIIADEIASGICDIVVTESGFGTDMGCEKFYNIKCRASGMVPNATVIVTTVRALKMHSGKFRIVAGKPLDPKLDIPDVGLVREGCENLRQHIRNVKAHGLPAVIAINAYPGDGEDEYEAIRSIAAGEGAFGTAISRVWAQGGAGGEELARMVMAACDTGADFHHLYDLDTPLADKIEKIAVSMYGASGVEYEGSALKSLKEYTAAGYAGLPVCMAKTHLSLSHDPALKGAPKGFMLPIREVRLAAGAGFVYPLAGEMRTMPGLPSKPGGEGIDIDDQGRVIGLF
ncbi:MAG: formate--tetrahydrofolate ligase [Candidatus Brocadiia bacterium]